MVWHDIIWYGVVWYGMVWYGLYCSVFYRGRRKRRTRGDTKIESEIAGQKAGKRYNRQVGTQKNMKIGNRRIGKLRRQECHGECENEIDPKSQSKGI